MVLNKNIKYYIIYKGRYTKMWFYKNLSYRWKYICIFGSIIFWKHVYKDLKEMLSGLYWRKGWIPLVRIMYYREHHDKPVRASVPHLEKWISHLVHPDWLTLNVNATISIERREGGPRFRTSSRNSRKIKVGDFDSGQERTVREFDTRL